MTLVTKPNLPPWWTKKETFPFVTPIRFHKDTPPGVSFFTPRPPPVGRVAERSESEIPMIACGNHTMIPSRIARRPCMGAVHSSGIGGDRRLRAASGRP